MNDLRFAFRQLLKNPGLTAVAVLTLALGIRSVHLFDIDPDDSRYWLSVGASRMNDDDSILEPRSVTKFYGDFKAVDGKSTSKAIV